MRPIDADALLEKMQRTSRYFSVVYDVDAMPTLDVAPVVHGRWVLLDECYNEGVYCSACHKKVYKKCYANQKIKSKFCPHCGAKMGGDTACAACWQREYAEGE